MYVNMCFEQNYYGFSFQQLNNACKGNKSPNSHQFFTELYHLTCMGSDAHMLLIELESCIQSVTDVSIISYGPCDAISEVSVVCKQYKILNVQIGKKFVIDLVG